MEKEKIEQLFTYLDETATHFEEQELMTYLEGIVCAGENLFHQEVCQEVTNEQMQKLEEIIAKVKEIDFDKEEIRKSFQLAILKGMKNAVQPHHSMTPDAVSLFVSYLVNKVNIKSDKEKVLLDLAMGSGNLLHTLINHADQRFNVRGVDVDETLLQLAYVSANLQKHDIDLFHRDSLEPLPFPAADFVVTDLPVGYYPKDDIAEDYELHRTEGHSYAHYLMVEQALNMTKEGGFLIFIIPNSMFETEQAEGLNSYIKREANVIALLQLPKTLFQNEQHGKSIFMLQKKGNDVRVPKQALLVELPSFSNKEALASMMEQMNKWFKEELSL